MSGMRYGIFDWVDVNGEMPLNELFEQRLRMLEYADEAGFFCYHVAEHHGTPLSMAPSPHLLLAALAQRTSRLRFGPLVSILPLMNPVRMVEEVCMLDHLSNGRLELGVGRGTSANEASVLGSNYDEARDRFDEALDILVQGLETGRIDFEGKYYTLHSSLPIRPLQQPYPPLWYPTSNPESVERIAKRGFNTLMGFTMPGLDETAHAAARYREVTAASKDEPGRYNPHDREPLHGVTRHVYVAETDERALDEARMAYSAFDWSFRDRPGRPPESSPSRRGDFDTALGRGLIIAGSPETVRNEVQRYVDVTGANYFVGSFAYGTMTDEQLMTSVRLFAEEVMPAVGA
jgi:alkanesulfonate monooxygenase SsuD/methylene tetrahydromethanopterin reductase-like flavin-dependent oxidoreductase (luciferase family)